MFISTCFKFHCSRRVEENTCSDSSFCTFELVPGFVSHFLFSYTFCFFLFLYFHISSKSPSYTWLKLCDLLTYEMECLCSCLENPRDGGAWWAAVYEVAQSRTRLKRLGSSSSSNFGNGFPGTSVADAFYNLFTSLITTLPPHSSRTPSFPAQGYPGRNTRLHHLPCQALCHRLQGPSSMMAGSFECGFLPIPEQHQIKFKSLQKSYRKVRNAHMLEPCAFFEEWVLYKPREILSLPRLKRTGISAKEQINLVEGEDAAEESDRDEMGVDGVHWGYEETKTFLDIFHETRFYEVLQAYHRKSKLYGALAEQLLQKSYHKVKNGQVLESCGFYKEMDALINSWASAAPTSSPEEALSPSVQERDDMEIEPQETTGWDPEEDSQEALVEDSGSERMSEEEIMQEPEFQGPPGLLQNPKKAKRIISQNVDPGKYHKRACISGRQWESLHGIGQGKLMPQSRDLGKAIVHQRPLVGKRLFRLLSVEESFGRSVRLMCRMTHQKENPSKCSVCGKCFGRSRSLVQHQRIHMGENPFKSLNCGKSFKDSSNFDAHQRIHTGEKPYREWRVAHRRVHSGKNPYKCVDCEKSFNNCTRFHEHQGVHTGEKPSGRIQCGRHFSKSSVLIKHREVHVRGKLCQPCQHSAPRRTP
ncbi:hypothetical protein FD755_014039 [Muntiacus reevesi]|uniref:C2H2-type domain-containing protein n=1 Tax=Muntiacus reevesi TaxID=9886 RepID=A0A5N3XJG2_MUNRE|nr:hypothetical protein FD755_014039 [Muntiacus reevesi]